MCVCVFVCLVYLYAPETKLSESPRWISRQRKFILDGELIQLFISVSSLYTLLPVRSEVQDYCCRLTPTATPVYLTIYLPNVGKMKVITVAISWYFLL